MGVTHVPGQRSLRVLLVSTAELGGGAERSAWNLFKSYRSRGHKSWLAVGFKHTDDPAVVVIPNDLSRSVWKKACVTASNWLKPQVGRVRGVGRSDGTIESHWRTLPLAAATTRLRRF